MDGFTILKEEVITFSGITSWEQLDVPIYISVKKNN